MLEFCATGDIADVIAGPVAGRIVRHDLDTFCR
jgi:hypothetical protein